MKAKTKKKKKKKKQRGRERSIKTEKNHHSNIHRKIRDVDTEESSCCGWYRPTAGVYLGRRGRKEEQV